MPVAHPTEAARAELLDEFALDRYGVLLVPPTRNQLLVQVHRRQCLLDLARDLDELRFHLVTAVADDERELEDRCFKLYYVFSHPDADLFVQVEYLLPPGDEPPTYPSLHPWYAAVDSFEREIRDLLGLVPEGERGLAVQPGSWLHAPYPRALFPLRRDRTIDQLRRQVAAGGQRDRVSPPADGIQHGDGMVLPVGPIHAGVIEPGQFLLRVVGEAIEDVDIRLGYTHKGIERLFQSRLSILDGWRLAEQVSGDSSFAHSLAYCHAAEALTETTVPPGAELLRGVFLELERVHNHVGDIAALAEDVGLERVASHVGAIRERLLRLNERLSGSRYLRRLNRPGGISLRAAPAIGDLRTTLRDCLVDFERLAGGLSGRAEFRNRTIGIGVLQREQARRLGVTGLAARACGIRRDYRLEHPTGVYRDVRAELQASQAGAQSAEAQAGDVHARFLTRVHEVYGAHAIIRAILDRWDGLPDARRGDLLREPTSRPKNNYTFALGYAEGFRGDIFYWLMQDKLGGIYRCKVRDPSMLNWAGMRHSLLPRTVAGGLTEATLLPDFPLVNKSFNLSYSGNDL